MLLQGAQARPHTGIHDINACFEVLPQPLDGVQLGAVGGQPYQHDVFRHLDALCPMRGGLVQQDNVQTLCIVLAKLLQKEGEAIGIEAGPLPPEGVAGPGFDGCLQPVRLVQRFDDLEGLHAKAGHAATRREMEAQPAFVMAAPPHRRVRRLPAYGGDGPQAARTLLDTIRGLSRFFLAWLGLGRFSLALSW